MISSDDIKADIDEILSHRCDFGYDFWTTPDKRLQKGSPFTIFESAIYLLELGVSPENPILQQCADLIFSVWQPDGRFKTYPTGTIYPCQTAIAALTLCHLGYATDDRLKITFDHLRSIQQSDGGWRCSKFSFGHGPETLYSNSGPTLSVLDAFHHSLNLLNSEASNRAVEFLLKHWQIRSPIGPCHYGIGSLFMQVEYPFRGYNLFQYVYVLSFFEHARSDERFLDALHVLKTKLVDNQIVVERVVPKLASLNFCRKGLPSELATKRFQEIVTNLRQ